MELLARTRVGRDINRHYYTSTEVAKELARPVVQRLMDLIRVRNEHPAFGGAFHLEPGSDDTTSAARLACNRFTKQRYFDHRAFDAGRE